MREKVASLFSARAGALFSASEPRRSERIRVGSDSWP